MTTIAVLDAEFDATVAELANGFDGIKLVAAADLASVAPESIDVLITQFETVGQEQLDTYPNLQSVVKMGINYANLDTDELERRGIPYMCVPRKGPNCVAELAMTFILSLSKDLLMSHQSVETGAYRMRGLRPERSAQWKMAFHWMKHATLHEVRGKTLGIVGMGEIGCELAMRARAMGMRILYTKRSPLREELEHEFSARYRDLDDLLAESDYVCLAVPHTDETEGMMGAAQFERMQSHAFLVNICRGGVVDEDAMIHALQTQSIAGAGLDVFTYEPLPFDSPLCTMHNVILTPHVGGGSGTNRALELTETLDEFVQRAS